MPTFKTVACAAYFHDSWIEGIVGHLEPAQVSLRLWALDRPRPNLQALTHGHGLRPKWPIIADLMAGVPADFDYVLIFDDDIILPPDFWPTFLDLMIVSGADLAQPALTRDSFWSHAITLQDLTCWGRLTNFVECGPCVCMSRRFYELTLPYLDPISPMGWAYEAQWTFLVQRHGMTQAIIDRCPVKQCRPLGLTYARPTAPAQARLYLEKYGLKMPVHVVQKYLR